MKKEALQIRFQLRAQPVGVGVMGDGGRLPKVTQAMALAIHFEDLIRTDQAKDYADVARMNGLSRERVSQIARLNFLAPDIQVALLHLPPTPTGHCSISEVAIRRIANLLPWPAQRLRWRDFRNAYNPSQ